MPSHTSSPALQAALLSGKPSINYSYQQIMDHSALRQGLTDRCSSLQWIFSLIFGKCQQSFVRTVKIFKASRCLCCLTEDDPSFPVMSPELLVVQESVESISLLADLLKLQTLFFFPSFPSALCNMNYNWNRIQPRHLQKRYWRSVTAEMPLSPFSPEILVTWLYLSVVFLQHLLPVIHNAL